MTLSKLAEDIAQRVRAADGFVKGRVGRMSIEVGGEVLKLLDWWLSQRYPIQPEGTDAYALFYLEAANEGKSDNESAVRCALDCGCGGGARGRVFVNTLRRKLGQ